MVKWFCDICGLEIPTPLNLERVVAYRCVKNHDDADRGWGYGDDIVKVFCHKECADILQTELDDALVRAVRRWEEMAHKKRGLLV